MSDDKKKKKDKEKWKGLGYDSYESVNKKLNMLEATYGQMLAKKGKKLNVVWVNGKPKIQIVDLEPVEENTEKAVKDMISRKVVKKGQSNKDRVRAIGKWLDDHSHEVSAKYNDNWIRRIKMGRGGQVQDWWGDTMTMIKNRLGESVNEAGMELNKLKDAIKMFQKKIEKQGRVTNARDEEHLSNLIKLYIQMGGKGIKESDLPTTSKKEKTIRAVHKTSGKELVYVDTPSARKKLKRMGFVVKESINEELKRGFMVHSDPDATEKDWKSQFKLLAQGHPQPISYGPRESDIYDWNDRSNYRDAIQEYNKYMTGISIKLNAAVKDMNNIWKVWDKISNKYRKKDGGR